MTVVQRWSVTVLTEGDRVVELDEIVELADAVAAMGGIASGVGTMGYGAQIVVAAPTRAEALLVGTDLVLGAARAAGLPDWPVASVSAIGEHEEEGETIP